ncbi:MAG: hypothetical protein ACFFCS_04755 [Candidatus Hodarchaeota archaeon]
MEINLFFYDKVNRTVKNIGEWLDNALQFFAVVDILFTIVFIIDSGLSGGALLLIACLVLIVFALFIIFTVAFNRFFHSTFKIDFKKYLKEKYLIPLKKVHLPHQYYYCKNCNAILNYIESNFCSECGHSIPKCSICGDVITAQLKSKEVKEGDKPEFIIERLVGKMEAKLDGVEEKKEEAAIACPECGILAHVDEFYSWLKLRGKCPACKKKISDFEYFGD